MTARRADAAGRHATLRMRRVVRALRILRAARAVRLVSWLRRVTSLNRGMRAIGYVIALTTMVTFAGAAVM